MNYIEIKNLQTLAAIRHTIPLSDNFQTSPVFFFISLTLFLWGVCGWTTHGKSFYGDRFSITTIEKIVQAS